MQQLTLAKGNNTPVFFLRDPLRFPDLNHAVKRDPGSNLRSAQNNWDCWTLLPEALHQVTYVMGDRGLPDGYRYMHGFGSHSFTFINAANERSWVKFHVKSLQGIRNLSDAEPEAPGRPQPGAKWSRGARMERGRSGPLPLPHEQLNSTSLPEVT